MGKTPTEGDWNVQISFSKPDGTLINLRGQSVADVTALAADLGAAATTISTVATEIGAGPRPSAFGGAKKPWPPKTYTQTSTANTTTTTPAGANAAAQGAKDLGDGTKVLTTFLSKIFAGNPSKNNPEKNGPGTVVDAQGQKYDTFDTKLLQLGKDAITQGQRVNLAFRFNERFNRNELVEGGLTIFGVVPKTENVMDQAPAY